MGFQAGVSAWFAAHLLSKAPIGTRFGLGRGAIANRLQFETGRNLDDIEVQLSDGSLISVQCKTTVTLSVTEGAPLARVVGQLVNLYRSVLQTTEPASGILAVSTSAGKARELSGSDLSRNNDPYTVMPLRLQAAFGLRCGQSIKIRPEWADRGNHLALQDTWTQGGRARRELPIPNSEQRQVLNEAKLLAGRGSLIPVDRSYVDQLRRFEHQCAAAGVHRIHGHRHRMRRFGTGNSPNGRHRQPVDRSQRI